MMMVSLSANHAMESRVLTPQHILKVGHAFRGAKTLLSAVELHVFTALADGPAGPETLSSRTGVHQRGARDFFDALVALGMLERDYRGLDAATPETAFYLHRNKRDFYAVGV